MSDYSLVPVDHQPDFENVSLVPVDHDPFVDDGVTQQAQDQQAAQTQPVRPLDQPQQPAAGVERLYVGPRREITQELEAPAVLRPQPPTPTSNAATPSQVLRGTINDFIRARSSQV